MKGMVVVAVDEIPVGLGVEMGVLVMVLMAVMMAVLETMMKMDLLVVVVMVTRW